MPEEPGSPRDLRILRTASPERWGAEIPRENGREILQVAGAQGLDRVVRRTAGCGARRLVAPRGFRVVLRRRTRLCVTEGAAHRRQQQEQCESADRYASGPNQEMPDEGHRSRLRPAAKRVNAVRRRCAEGVPVSSAQEVADSAEMKTGVRVSCFAAFLLLRWLCGIRRRRARRENSERLFSHSARRLRVLAAT